MNRILIFSIILLCSCGPKMQRCSEVMYKAPGTFGFIGFTSQDLDTIFITQYVRDSTFSTVISRDTIITTRIDTSTGFQEPYMDSTTLPMISVKADIGIVLPSAGRTFLAHAAYSNDSVEYWQEEGCRGRGFVMYPGLYVNGVLSDSNYVYVVIKK